MTTTTPTKGAVTYLSATAGDTITHGVANPYALDFSSALNGGLVQVRVTPSATLTTGALVQILASDEQGTPTYFDTGLDALSGLTSGQNYDFAFIIPPQFRKGELLVTNQDGTNSIVVKAWYTLYTSVSTA